MGLQINRAQCLSPLPRSRGPAVLKNSDPLVWSSVVYPGPCTLRRPAQKPCGNPDLLSCLISELPALAWEVFNEPSLYKKVSGVREVDIG